MEQSMGEIILNKKARDRFVDYLIRHERGYVRSLGWFVQKGWPEKIFENAKDLATWADAKLFTPRNLGILLKSWDEYERSMKNVRKERQNDSVSKEGKGADGGKK